MIEQVRYEQHITHPIKIAYDEWNVWYRKPGTTNLEEAYDLTDALAVATYLNIFIRHCTSVGMANLAQLVNVIAPIFTSPDGLFLQSIYHPFWLYATLSHEIALDIYIESDQYTLTPEAETAAASWWTHRVAELGPFKLLDATATCDPDRRQIALAVVNRDRDAAHAATIRFADGVAVGIDAHEINGPEVVIHNSFEQPQAISIQHRPLEGSGSAFDYTFPAHSVTMLRFQMDERAAG